MNVSKRVMRLITMSVFVGIVGIVGACGDKESSQSAKVAEVVVPDKFIGCPELTKLYSNESIATIYFPLNEFYIMPSAQEVLTKLSYCMADLIVDKIEGTKNAEERAENLSDLKFLIEGNCDSRGSVEYNLALGTKRAGSAKNVFVKEDLLQALTERLKEAKIDAPELISSTGLSSLICETSKGKNNLIDSGNTEVSHARNRRDEFYVVKSCSNYDAALSSHDQKKKMDKSDSIMITDEEFEEEEEYSSN